MLSPVHVGKSSSTPEASRQSVSPEHAQQQKEEPGSEHIDPPSTQSDPSAVTPCIQPEEEDPSLVINMIYSEDICSEDMIWDTNQERVSDSDEGSITSTPDFKHGKHEDTQMAIQQLVKESQLFKLDRNQKASVLLLADARIKHWPKDTLCSTEYHPQWN